MRDPNDLKTTLLELCAIASQVIVPYFREKLDVENKFTDAGKFDPVTIADRDAEAAIREVISARFPGD